MAVLVTKRVTMCETSDWLPQRAGLNQSVASAIELIFVFGSDRVSVSCRYVSVV